MTSKEHRCDEMPDDLEIRQRSYISDERMYLNLYCLLQPRGADEQVKAGAAVCFPVRFCPFCGEELR